MKIGNRIKEIRKSKMLTQTELANFLNTTQDTISLWEREKSNPDIEQLTKLALFFDVSTDYLLGLEDEDGHKEISEYNFEYSHKNTKLIHKEKI